MSKKTKVNEEKVIGFKMPGPGCFDVWYATSFLRGEEGRKTIDFCRKSGFGMKMVDQSVLDKKLKELQNNPEKFVRSGSGNMSYIQKDI